MTPDTSQPTSPDPLFPLERLTYRMAQEQLKRGELPMSNTVRMLVQTIDRLTAGRGTPDGDTQ